MLSRNSLLTGIFLAALAFAVIMPYLNRQRTASRRITCETRQMEAARALLRFEAANGRFPGYREKQTDRSDGDPQPTGWVFPVLPYLGIRYERKPKSPIAEDDRTGPWKTLFDTFGAAGEETAVPQEYVSDVVCPSDTKIDLNAPRSWTSFVVNTGCPDMPGQGDLPPDWWPNGVCFDMLSSQAEAQFVSLARLKSNDGASATLMLSENVDAGLWTSGKEAEVGFVWVDEVVDGKADPGDLLHRINQHTGEGDGTMRFARPSSRHKGGVNVAYCDGRTGFLSQDIDYRAFTYQMTSQAAKVKKPGSRSPVAPMYLVK